MTRGGHVTSGCKAHEPVCAENVIRLDLVAESPTVGRDGGSPSVSIGPARLTFQVEEPACGRERSAPATGDRAATHGTRPRRVHRVLNAIEIIRPETLVRWHREGFRRYWHWKSRNLGGRPRIDAALRALIRQMSLENMLWSAPRIRGELLKLGFTVAQSTVARYMVSRKVERRVRPH
jgi:hypothetical protein